MRNPISAKVDFCNTFHAKCLFLQSQPPNFRPKNHQKKQPGNRYEKTTWSKSTKKTLKTGPLSHQKIDKIRAWTSQGPSLCPPMSQDRPRIVPQDRPRVPQDAKVEAPSSQITTMGNKIHQKSIEIQAWPSKCPLLYSLVSQNKPKMRR